MRTSDDPVRSRLAATDQIELLEALEKWRDALPRACLVASAQIERTDTAPKLLFTIPAGFEAHLLVVHGDVGSNAGATAVLDVARISPLLFFVQGHSVLGAAGVGQKFPAVVKMGVVTQADVEISGRYTETGAPSTSGGPWTVTVLYSKAGN